MKIAQLFLLLLTLPTYGKTIQSNSFVMHDAPDWVTRNQIEKVANRIQRDMEWTIRKVPVYWHKTQSDFEKVHKFGKNSTAVTVKSRDTYSVHLGPNINKDNFFQTFGHELVHVISFQKYKGAIPKWLEEGVANHIAKKKPVNYKWLAKQPFPTDVRSMTHPQKGSRDQIVYRYVASQALAEMLDKKCKLERLLQLSVQRKMDDYISTYCEIKDLNQAFKDWVQKKAKS